MSTQARPEMVSTETNTQEEVKEDHNKNLINNIQDLRNSLENWLDEAEDLMRSQKPPSADPNVLKAQLQSYTIHVKLVEDKSER